jgi:hypothetical protein
MPSDQPRRALLRILDPDVEPTTLLLDRPVLQIGRARETCNLVLTGPGIAAHHCSLRREGERWLLRDRGSSTGTHVNSRRCHEPTELHDGDRISLGLHLLEFHTAPSLELPHVLARLRDAPVDLQFNLDTTRSPPVLATPRVRNPGLLRSAALAAAAALALTLGVAANIAAAPTPPASPTPRKTPRTLASTPPPLKPQSSYMSMGTSTMIPTSAPDDRAEYLAEPPTFELPIDALGRGRPDDGALVHALALPPSSDYTIRCPAHAHASSATITELMHALASFRNRSDYRGELVVGDLSQHSGGRYGPHRSHQSGRDVDLWLPIRGPARRGTYDGLASVVAPPRPTGPPPGSSSRRRPRRRPGHLPRLGPQPALRAAAAPGRPRGPARAPVHPVRGRATLVKHAAGHIHHLHVRFRCPTNDPACLATR